MRRTLLSVFLFALASTFAASAAPTRISVKKLGGEAIVIDGNLDDAGWQGAQKVETFVEYFRGDNVPATAPTTAWIGYDDSYVYAAFRNEDPRPVDIRAPLADRDKVLGDQDYVAVLLDPLNDRRSGVSFRVNARGVQTDSVVNDANGEEDFSPDFFYDAVAQRTPNGWTAELRIPLSSLRYPAADPQTWGVILMRNYPRDFRYVMSNTPIPKSSGCFVCHAASLEGLSGLPAGSHLRLTPYSTANVSDRWRSSPTNRALPPTANRSFESDLGLDLKWSPSARLTVDGTLNPDFSQIESDVPQSTVNARFALAYDEKRTFFLESVDLLSMPMQVVYTRTITSPSWGIRATGQSGANAYTLLVAEDRGGGSMVLPGTNGSDFVPQDFRSKVLIGRLRRSIGQSFGGLLLSAREIEGGGHNRIFGPDFLWKPNATDQIAGQVVVSDTENPNRPELSAQFDGRSGTGTASRVYFQRDTKRYDLWAATSQYSPEFRADNGFVVQNGVRRVGTWGGLRTYPKRFLSYVRTYAGFEHDIAWEGGSSLRTGLYQGVYVQGKWGLDAWANTRIEKERVGGALLDTNSLELDVRVVPTRWLPQVRLSGIVGQRIDYAGGRVGSGASLNLSTTFRSTDHLEVQLRATRDWLDLDGGRLYSADLDWLKLTYNFTARSLARVIAQQSEVERNGALYASPVKERDRSLTFSGLYGYKLNWQTVFFVGFGDSSITADRGVLDRENRSVFMKVAYAFQR